MDMPKTTQYLVAEMGMSGAGEIAYLTNLTEPDVGLITVLAPVHLEQMGSLEAIAAAKGELLQGLKADGIAVIPSQEPRLLPFIQHLPKSQCLFFGTRSHDDVRLLSVKSRGIDGSLVELSVQGELIEFYLPLVGEHNARNAAAAAAAALALNIPPSRIKEGLSQPPQLSHRSSVRKLGPFHILDDCYNASPLAVKAALKAVVELADHNGCSAPAVAVLGSMLELGVQAEFYHQEVGAYAATLPLSRLITVGPLAAHIARGAIQAEMKPDRVHVVDTISEAAVIISAQVPTDAWILVKASRGARLEELFEKLSALEQS
jgi:UDP-N-acetylmuramoyl-tripeptide--D-alanyl-D-alanine ligase